MVLPHVGSSSGPSFLFGGSGALLETTESSLDSLKSPNTERT